MKSGFAGKGLPCKIPRIITFNGTQWKFGKYVTQERPRGGFLPIFWDVPGANIHAVEDIGAVVDWLTERCEFQADAKSNLFRASKLGILFSWLHCFQRGHHLCWNDGPYRPSCPNQSGIPTGGRKKSFLLLSEDEQMVQYARATLPSPERDHSVSLGSPWHERPFGGSYSHGYTHVWCCVWAGQAFLSSWWWTLPFTVRWNVYSHAPTELLPVWSRTSLAIVEALQDYVTHYYKVRRLHLIVVDLWRPWKYNTAWAREITDQLWRISYGDDTHRVSPFRPVTQSHLFVAVDLHMDMLWMALNIRVTWCGHKGMGNPILF